MRTPRSIARYLAAAAACVLAISTSPLSAQTPSPRSTSKYLFAWTADSSRHASDCLAVIDADPMPKCYGHIVASVPAGAMGTLPHHTEYEFPRDGILFANGWAASQSFIFDLRNPTAPKLLTSFKDVGPYAFPHSFVRLPNGRLLATAQGKGTAYAPPGGLVEVEERGTPIRSASAAGMGLVDADMAVQPCRRCQARSRRRHQHVDADSGMATRAAWLMAKVARR